MRKFSFLLLGATGIFLLIFYPHYIRTGEDINIQYKEERKIDGATTHSLENIANKQEEHGITVADGQLHINGGNHNNDQIPMNENMKVMP